MHIIIAADSFKGTLSSLEAGNVIKEGALSVFPSSSIEVLPMADGGEGTVEAVLHCTAGEKAVFTVTGPLGEPVQASYGRLSGNRAIMEMAEASGLMLVPKEKRNPLLTSTMGTGEMIARAMEDGARKIFLGIGGSATCDGGMGAMEALGFRFLDKEGKELPGRGASLSRVDRIDLSSCHPLLKETDLMVLSDVKIPFAESGAPPLPLLPRKGRMKLWQRNWNGAWRITGTFLKKPLAEIPMTSPEAALPEDWERRSPFSGSLHGFRRRGTSCTLRL